MKRLQWKSIMTKSNDAMEDSQNQSQIPPKKSKITLEGIINNAREMITYELSIEDTLDMIINTLPNYHPSYEKLKKEKSFWKKVVIVIDNILNSVKGTSYSIAKRNEHIYVYNGCFWQLAEPDILRKFVSKASLKQGISPIMAVFTEFIDKLIRQLQSAADLLKAKNNTKGMINLVNGTLIISKEGAQLREFNKDDILTYQIGFLYDPFAEAPIFQKYINRVLPQKELQKILAEYLGYIFLPSNVLQLEKAMLLYGKGANGKSVLFNIINTLLGKIIYATIVWENSPTAAVIQEP